MDKFDRYWKLSEMEERFNASSAGVRALASAWLLASVAALGWLLDPAKPNEWAIPLGLLVIAVCVLAVLGLGTLWVLDQLVFHRLLNSVFLIGLSMEITDTALPPIRALMMKTVEGKGTHRWELFFYIGPVVLFALMSAVLAVAGSGELFTASADAGRATDVRWIGYLLATAQIAVLLWVISKQRSVGMERRAAWFGDRSFEMLVETGTYEDVVKAWQSARTARSGPAPG